MEYFETFSFPEDADGSLREGNEPVLFTVKARDLPDSDFLQTIGHVKLTSNLHRSKFGDQKLFFRHERYRRDIGFLKTVPALVARKNAFQAGKESRIFGDELVVLSTEDVPGFLA